RLHEPALAPAAAVAHTDDRQITRVAGPLVERVRQRPQRFVTASAELITVPLVLPVLVPILRAVLVLRRRLRSQHRGRSRDQEGGEDEDGGTFHGCLLSGYPRWEVQGRCRKGGPKNRSRRKP